MRPHACTEGTRRSEAGECASAARGQRCRLGKHEEKSQGHGAFRKSRAAPLNRERPLAPLMTCSRVLAWCSHGEADTCRLNDDDDKERGHLCGCRCACEER